MKPAGSSLNSPLLRLTTNGGDAGTGLSEPEILPSHIQYAVGPLNLRAVIALKVRLAAVLGLLALRCGLTGILPHQTRITDLDLNICGLDQCRK